jgi:hypoxanthine phosphoribosyltransferase
VKLDFVNEILFNEEEVDKAISKISSHIMCKGFKKDTTIIFVVLNGGLYLSNRIFHSSDYDVRYIQAKSYIDNKRTDTVDLDIMLKDMPDIKDKEVLIIDDIYDSGSTLSYINEKIIKLGANNVSNIVLVKRTGYHKYDIPISLFGLEVTTDDFLVGCGMDYNGDHRKLPYIASVKESK